MGVAGGDLRAHESHVAAGGAVVRHLESAADRILDHLAPLLAISPVRRLRKHTGDIVDGTLVPTRDRTSAASSMNNRHPTNQQVVINANSRPRRGDRACRCPAAATTAVGRPPAEPELEWITHCPD